MNEIVIPQKTASGLQLYDPQKGLLSIAAAETAQKHFARAKKHRERVARKMKELGTPFVTLSGYSPQQQPGIFNGAAWLMKPLQPELLVAQLAHCTRARRP